MKKENLYLMKNRKNRLFTEYDSFSEALQVAESIDPHEINPFPLWNEKGGSSLEKYKGDAS